MAEQKKDRSGNVVAYVKMDAATHEKVKALAKKESRSVGAQIGVLLKIAVSIARQG